jgi:hypothetical protein
LLGGLPTAPGDDGAEGAGKLARSGEAIGAETAASGNTSAALSWKERKKLKQVRSKAERELKDLPAKIEVLETELAEFDRKLTDPAAAGDWEGLFVVQKERRVASDALDGLYTRWQELESLIEGAE